MDRLSEERKYWNKAALDADVDRKYISDIGTLETKNAIGKLPGNVLEIGCGVGRLMESGWYGIDISENMIEIARTRRPDCHFIVTDGRFIPLDDASLDCVFAVLLFQHIPFSGVSLYIREVSRVLKDGGIFRFQYIKGSEDEPFSKHHDETALVLTLGFNKLKTLKIERGLVHPQWTWITAKKMKPSAK